MTCPVCGNLYEVENHDKLSRPAKACSYKCRAQLTAATSMKKYGCRAPGNSKEAREKSRQTCIQRLGVEYPLQNEAVHQKQIESLKNHLSVTNPGQIKSLFKEKEPLTELSLSECRLLVLRKKYADQFLNKHDPHRASKQDLLCLGYVYNDELVEVMTFGRSDSNKFDYQIFRICRNKYRVNGGILNMLELAAGQFELYPLCCRITDLNIPLKEIYDIDIPIV